MDNARKTSVEKIKAHIRENFNRIRRIVDIREKLLMRQIDVLAHSKNHADTQTIDEVKFIPENEKNVLMHIQTFGKFNLDNYNFTNNAFTIEDYICPNVDHDLMYKFITTSPAPKPTDEDIADVKEHKLSKNTNILTMNLKNNETASNGIDESQLTIDSSNKKIEDFIFLNNNSHVNYNAKLIEKKLLSVEYSRNNHIYCNTNNLSRKPTNRNVKGLAAPITTNNAAKKKIKLLTTTTETTTSDPKNEDDHNATTYNCEFYDRLFNKMRNDFLKNYHNNATATTIRNHHSLNSSQDQNIKSFLSSSSTSEPNNFGENYNCNNILLKFLKNCRTNNIPNGIFEDSYYGADASNSASFNTMQSNLNNSSSTESTASTTDTTNPPFQIEQWLKQIILETEIEPMQTIGILEHRNITM